jgi:transcriptional regulator with XRE-family HTH domain
MNADLIDPQALLRLRTMCKLSHARVARLCDLSEAQVHELETGGYSQFASRDMKVQAAMKVAITLSGAQPNGMPVVNVFHSHAASQGMGRPLPPIKFDQPTVTSAKPKFPDTPEFFKLMLIFVVMVFLLVAVAMPLLYTLPSPPPKLT